MNKFSNTLLTQNYKLETVAPKKMNNERRENKNY